MVGIEQDVLVRLRDSKLGDCELAYTAISVRRLDQILELSLPKRVLVRNGKIFKTAACINSVCHLDIRQVLTPELYPPDKREAQKEQESKALGWASL